jgi:hypothetical protein
MRRSLTTILRLGGFRQSTIAKLPEDARAELLKNRARIPVPLAPTQPVEHLPRELEHVYYGEQAERQPNGPQIPVRPPEPPKTRSWFDYARQNVPALSGIGALLAVAALIGLGTGFQISRRFILPLRRQRFQSNPAPEVIQPSRLAHRFRPQCSGRLQSPISHCPDACCCTSCRLGEATTATCPIGPDA